MRNALRRLLDQYAPAGRPWLVLGAVALVVDAWLSGQYGWAQSYGHAIGFALLAIIWCMLPDQTYAAFRRRSYGIAAVLLVASIPVCIMSAQSHLGYGSSVRLGDMQQTDARNARFADARNAVRDNEAAVKILIRERDELARAQPWAATVSADGLRSQLQAASLAVEQEAKRGGCGSRCLELTREKASLEERIALAERLTDYGRRIETIHKALGEARAKAAAVEYQSSAVVNINRTAAQLMLAATGRDDPINPDDTAMQWCNILLAAGNTLAFLVMAPVCFLVAGCYRTPEASGMHVAESVEPVSAPTHQHRAPRPISLNTTTVADLRRLAAA